MPRSAVGRMGHSGNIRVYSSQWCEVDACPSSICNGPHVSHHCPNGDLVAQRFDDATPCPFCGHEAPASGRRPNDAS